MSISMLSMFAVSMLAAVTGKLAVGTAGTANLICLSFLGLCLILSRVQGIRKPVV